MSDVPNDFFQRWPNKYSHNQDCKWVVVVSIKWKLFTELNNKILLKVPSGKVTLTFQSFNVEWSSNCKKKDYLFVGQILTYSNVSWAFWPFLILCFQTYLCGNTIPKGTQFKSKNQQMTIKFHSNNKVTRAGFKVLLRGNN